MLEPRPEPVLTDCALIITLRARDGASHHCDDKKQFPVRRLGVVAGVSLLGFADSGQVCGGSVAINGRRVITIDDLQATASELLERVRSQGWEPDLVVGIERGGAEIARVMSAESRLPLVTLRIQRPSTSKKNRGADILRGVLRRSPRWAADILRQIEDWWLRRKHTASPPAFDDAHDLDVRGDSELLNRATCTLIVDDAIDSGSTLAMASDFVAGRSAATSTLVRAVVARTRPPQAQAVSPEVVLHERVLVRFPWALDYRPPRDG